MIEEGLRTLFLAEPTITNKVGTRIYVLESEQNSELPLILIVGNDVDAMGGIGESSPMDDGSLKNMVVDFECYAASEPSARLVSRAVASFMDDFVGAAGTNTIKATVSAGYELSAINQDDGGGHSAFVGTYSAKLFFE